MFPYYIVRFKLLLSHFSFLFYLSFHTTQYDLNAVPVEKRKYASICFHTTQYDLNQKKAELFRIPRAGFHTTQYDLNTEPHLRLIHQSPWFPYYIVRFKLFRYLVIVVSPTGFHTTQYDLNHNVVPRPHSLKPPFPYYIVRFKQNSRIEKAFEIAKFPYYIVRFKHRHTSFSQHISSCFHTTQYDLNHL